MGLIDIWLNCFESLEIIVMGMPHDETKCAAGTIGLSRGFFSATRAAALMASLAARLAMSDKCGAIRARLVPLC